jgi:hypothetical protein
LLSQLENHASLESHAANSAEEYGPKYLSTRRAAVYLGLGEEAKDGVPTIGSTYRNADRIVTLKMIVGNTGALVGDDGHALGWVDLARLDSPDFPLVSAADPLGPALQRMEKWRLKGKGPRCFKLGPARGEQVFYAVDDLDQWMAMHRNEHRRAG